MKLKGLYILLVLALLLASCAAPATPTPAPATVAPATEAATEAPTEVATEAPTEAPVVCEQQVKIGIIGAMSGTTASLGDYMKKGVTLAVEQKNAEGGIQGCQIQLVVYDDEGDPTKSTGLAQKVATEDEVMAVWATTNSSTALSDLPIFEQYKIPQMTNGTNVDITRQGSAYIFRAGPAGPAFENSLIDHLVKQEGFTKFAIIGDNTAYGKGESAYQIDALKANNLEALAVEEHGADDKDFTGQLTKIMATQPEVLLLANSEVAGGLVAKQARQLGFEGTIAGGVAMGSAKFLETAGDAAEGVFFTAAYPGNEANDQTKAFAAAFKERWGIEPEFHNANTYDLTQVLFIAMENAKPLTPENVAAEMHKVCGYQSLQGKMCIDETGESLTTSLVGVIKDGKLTYFDQ
jgi:branched-chain amino acid transport system substrate-binding protein